MWSVQMGVLDTGQAEKYTEGGPGTESETQKGTSQSQINN